MDALPKGWFSEVNSQWPGQALSLEVAEVLHDQKSKYQHVQVFRNKVWGTVLVLDGVIQVTQKDEIAYHELIAHIPLFSHKKPENVLIVGGGDGGTMREVLKHPSVKKVVICEIDQMVIDVAKKYLPQLAVSYSDPRVTVVCQDAAKYMEQKEVLGTFDVIIADTSDPVGPAAALFEAPFYKCMYHALRAGGKVCTQAESIWLNLDLIQKLISENMDLYANVEYATTQIPTYPCGQIGFLLCSKGEDDGADTDSPQKGKGKKKAKKRKTKQSKKPTCSKPVRKNTGKDFEKATFKYYSEGIHKAAFVLPKFVEDALLETRTKHEEDKEKKAEESTKEKEKAKEDSKEKEKEKDKSNGDKAEKDKEEDGQKKRKRDDDK
jgi:spermidine synthase